MGKNSFFVEQNVIFNIQKVPTTYKGIKNEKFSQKCRYGDGFSLH